jgi:hypothetical protein
MTPDESFRLATLVIFAFLSLPALYCLVCHGFRHLAWLGWLYAIIFCSLKIVGAGLAYGNSSGKTANIIISVGLSPLLLATAGVLHEAFVHLAGQRTKQQIKQEYLIVLVFHVIVAAGIAVLVSGASSLPGAKTVKDADTYQALMTAGVAVLLACWLALAITAIFIKVKTHDHKTGARLMLGVLLALPFLGVRVIGSLVAIATRDASLNSVTGTIGARVGLYLLMEIIVLVLLINAGLATRRSAKRGTREGRYDQDHELGARSVRRP